MPRTRSSVRLNTENIPRDRGGRYAFGLAESRFDAPRAISLLAFPTLARLGSFSGCPHRRQSPFVPDQARPALSSDISPHPLLESPFLTNSPVGPLIRRPSKPPVVLWMES
ncbi:hypothetical protein GSI_14121 [Ganoderma sinense ZZ0214-1]|uniref:Uncharacterized protein n=1 Tax=Ganoderma sinense ZZ0214-1 TaxID=1077348 RepID=A0A2G8RSQ0_9APHY|nr:hypothetical protein GSI_14121 [Ganoderma sinense ZZ0214-1]